jgi:hypothetical protein
MKFMSKTIRKTLFAFLAIAIIAGSIGFMPWKIWLENWLKTELSAQGMAQLEFTIESIGLKEIALKDIAFGELKLPDLAIGYTPLELLNKNFRNLHASSLVFHKDKLSVELIDVSAHLAPDEHDEKFIGEWEIKQINISDAPLPIAPLSGKGKLELAAGILHVTGDISSKDAITKASFTLNYSITETQATNDNNHTAILTVKNFTLPWSEGTLSAQDIAMPLHAKTPINIPLKVKSVSLNSLLALATNNRGSATGLVSGTLPLTIERDGKFILKKGALQAEKNGKIMLSPDMIPSTAPQVAMLREVLANFNYELLNIKITSANNKQISLSLSVQGNNPDLYNGRAIKLNVNLTGDLGDGL